MLYFIIIFLIFFIFLSRRRLDWSLMLILFCLPAYQVRFSFLGLPMTLLEVMILVCFAVWFFTRTKFVDFVKRKYGVREYIAEKKKRIFYPFQLELSLLLIISYIATGVAGFSNEALGIWKAYFFEPILVFILILNVFREEDTEGNSKINFEKIIYPLLLSGFVVSVFAIFQKVTGLFIVPNFWPRVTGVFAYPNALGLYLAPIIFLINNYELRIKNYRYWLSVGLIIVYLLAIVFASSEGALVGILAGLFVVGLLWMGDRLGKRIYFCLARIFIFLFLGFSIIAPWFFLNVIPEHKYFNFSNPVLNFVTDKMMLKDFSGEVRKQQWRETWKMMTASPARFIFGTGLSGYQENVASYHQEGIFFNHERDADFRRKIVWEEGDYKAKHWRPVEIYMYPHNIFLNFWTELGLAGMVLFIWIIGKAMYLSLKIYEQKSVYKGIALGLVGAMVAIFVHGLVDVPYFKNDLAVVFWVLLAVLGALGIGIRKDVRYK